MPPRLVRSGGRRAAAMAFLAFLLLLAGRQARAEERMPAPRFASFLARLLTYDTTLQNRAGGSIVIAVLHQRGNHPSMRESIELSRALRTLELTKILDLPVKTLSIALTSVGELERAVETLGIDAFVVCSQVDGKDPRVKQVSEKMKVITIGSTSDQVRAGLAISVYLEDGKSKILINHSASKREGAALSSDLLRLSEVIP
jgi:hypothetical protein